MALKNYPIINEPSTVDVEKNYDVILDNFELTICIICGREVDSYWDSSYKGLRASCINCEINWAES